MAPADRIREPSVNRRPSSGKPVFKNVQPANSIETADNRVVPFEHAFTCDDAALFLRDGRWVDAPELHQ